MKKETKSFLIAAQNNAIRTNYVKGKIDKTQGNKKSRWYGYRDETINHKISECFKKSSVGVQDKTVLGLGGGHPQGIEQEIEIWQ